MNKVKAGFTAAAIASAATLAYQGANGLDTLTRVIDGDTIVINKTERVRLAGIDAPELDQLCTKDNLVYACGQLAKGYLESFFMVNVNLKCVAQKVDSYKRTVAKCYAINARGERHDIAKSLVSAGYALDWEQYSGGEYQMDERYARKHKLGIWQGQFEYPWDWRKEHKQ